ncbi:PREDICTED: mediator of RNA polymerase II transcription subunit 26 [Cyphomyrmex costatus]|uniref:Mediator of RNA polymerase II transcription subunit 26 n=1 Tax=Cyphomyrmex costatus TaxID=456900 RepID=A0A151IJR4_9HYME|nr:PREDICTED: mediator of RNA polymerase II transcription subunit 26 [Cyphomyrmex costatus]KYN03887.1 Mediator of RNA polymerase II transcription subunit 26 [Cyphomyrmex costatus]
MRDTPMQRICSELTEKLLKSLDKEYNVVDIRAVVDVISTLEKTTVTKEVLEITRLGKHINELRRKTSNEALAKRAKDLVRRWRDMVLPTVHSTPNQPTLALNGAKEMALRNLKPQSPALRELKPHSPLSLKDATPLRVLSPALSVHSDHSRSPNASSNNKQSISLTSNHWISSCSRNASPVLGTSNQNHVTEAVPRTHSSNKRLRKEESSKDQCQYYQSPHGTESTIEEVKKQRLNGENISGNLNSQVPSPTLKERISDCFAETSLQATNDEPGPKKRGRKKGSKSAKRQSFLEDSVKEKLASISRNPKLKTTQELLADLQARGSNCSPIGSANALPSQSVAEPPSTEDVLRGSNNEQVSKHLRCSNQKNSQSLRKSLASSETSTGKTQKAAARLKSAENCRESPSPESCQDRLREDDRISGTTETCRSPLQQDLTVEEILAKLPPLDPSSIDWGEDEERDDAECFPPPRDATAEDLERLHVQCIEGLNGNFQPRLSMTTACSDGDERSNTRDGGNGVSSGLSNVDSVKSVHDNQTDNVEFREWHQMLARPSYQGEILNIMPYVIID